MSEEIRVETHDGHKSPESPRTVIMMGKKYEVEEVLETKRVEQADGGGMEEHFRVRLKDYGEAEIVYHYSFGEWSKK